MAPTGFERQFIANLVHGIAKEFDFTLAKAAFAIVHLVTRKVRCRVVLDVFWKLTYHRCNARRYLSH
jgi:hypothetical protein